MKALVVAVTISAAAASHAAGQPDAVASFVEQTLHWSSYKRADADLNGDGRKEAFVYATDPMYCGSGGCNLVILSPGPTGHRVVMRATIIQLPITLLPTSTRGWRDVGVTVYGGGITRAYTARFRFNGRRYPSNPSLPSAVPVRRASGKVLIDN